MMNGYRWRGGFGWGWMYPPYPPLSWGAWGYGPGPMTPEEEREYLLEYKNYLEEELRNVEERLRYLDEMMKGR